MNEEIQVVPLSDREQWSRLLNEDGRPCQSWHYCWSLSASGIDAKLAVVRSGDARLQMPFFVREWQGSADVCTVIGLSGASMTAPSARPLRLWSEFAKAQGWVAGYIQIEAGSALPADMTDEVGTSNWVFLLDLRRDNPLADASYTIRSKLQKASKIGAVLADDRQSLTAALLDLYPATMRRVRAGGHYGFSTETLRRWAGDPGSLLLGAELEGRVEAVVLFPVAGCRAELHILANTERGRDLTAWLWRNAIERLRQRGVVTLNLGGGIQPGDGLYRFKEWCGAVPVPLQAVRQIYDRQRYDELCMIAGVSNRTDYFPAYRSAPAVATQPVAVAQA
jgi:hypothetical protein